MQNAVLKYYRDVDVTYRFTNRNADKQPITRRCSELIRKMIDGVLS